MENIARHEYITSHDKDFNIDIVTLKSGHVLTIGQGAVVLRSSLQGFMDGSDTDLGRIDHPSLEAGQVVGLESWNTGGGMMVDVVKLADGSFLGVSDECVCHYDDEDQFFGGEEPFHNGIINLL